MKCIIPITANGVTCRHECYANNQTVKITRENVMIKQRDTWSMEITFPLDIPENMRVFGHVNRIDVARRKAQFRDCTLYAGNTRVITGVGTVTYISNTEAKIQILAGKEEYRFRGVESQSYIDALQYDVPLEYFGIFPGKPTSEAYAVSDFEDMSEELLPYCCFATLADDEFVLNKYSFSNHGANVCQVKCAIQPNLWFVATACLRSLGYELRLSWMEYDVMTSSARVVQSEAYRLFPYIYICSNRRTKTDIARALPHWTIEKFLTEVENLFNVTFLLDSESHTATVIDNGNYQSEEIAVECVDEFTAEYDEDGIKFIGSSNLSYNISDIHNAATDISDEILQQFDVLEFDSVSAAHDTWVAMQSDEERVMTTIFKSPLGYFYTYKGEDGNNATVFLDMEAGQLQHLKRDDNTEDSIVLNIAPVAIKPTEYLVNERFFHGWMPHLGTLEVESNDDPDYYSVMQAISGEENPEENIAERMEVFSLGYIVEHLFFENENGQRKLNMRFPVTFVKSQWEYDAALNSLAIDRDRVSWASSQANPNTIGALHFTERTVENHIRHTFRFLFHGMPDPKKTYIIRGKRYLCDKIEVEIKDDQIQDLKTGYFYAML